MHSSLKVAFATVLSFIGTVAVAQTPELFRPYDCRKHGEPAVEEIAQDLHKILQESIEASIAASPPIIEPEGPFIIEIDTVDGWKSWSFVENFAFGKNRGDLPMITDLKSLHPFFRDRVIDLIEACKK